MVCASQPRGVAGWLTVYAISAYTSSSRPKAVLWYGVELVRVLPHLVSGLVVLEKALMMSHHSHTSCCEHCTDGWCCPVMLVLLPTAAFL